LNIPTITLPSGAAMPTYGLGTWRMGEDDRVRKAEVAALRHGLARGIRLIDTAEMYGEGEAESIAAEAIGPRRADVFIVSKVLPQNSTRRGTIAACERSLQRLKTDRLDLYLLHWRGAPPLQETVSAFVELKAAGKILDWGVSNFDVDDMRSLGKIEGANGCATNQVLYNLSRRGIEFDLMPYCRSRKIPIMAYSPIEQGRLLTHAGLREVAKRHNITAAQVALAWLIRQDGLVTIPKATTLKHVDDNLGALNLKLASEDLATLDKHFPAPTKPKPLDML
jgi:diketogulonate reductase-like aldo/keto reductase